MNSLELIEELITKINIIGNQSKVLSFIALKELEKGSHLVELYTKWKEKSIQNAMWRCKCWGKQAQ